MGFRTRFVALSAVAALSLPVGSGVAAAADSAVVLMYHRVGDDRYPSTSIRLEQFESHLAELRDGGYRVLPLADIVAAIRGGKPLPERAVGITFDDAYLSIYQNGWPRLKAAGFPFTLFMATDPVDQATAGGTSEYMTWEQVRELAAAGVAIGNHTASHRHMADSRAEDNRRDIERAAVRFQEKLGMTPSLFAYPYGEAGLANAKLVAEMGFPAAFSQFSGAIGPDPELFYLPRFALNETYGDIKRFRQVAGAKGLAVADITPADPLIDAANNPPAIGFTVRQPSAGLDRMSCFMSPERSQLERLGEVRFEVRSQKPFPTGRTRLNCTMPGEDGRWYWFGRQFYVAR